MKIALEDHEITTAIKNYIEHTGVDLEGMDVDITLKNGRTSKDGTKKGSTAEVTIMAKAHESRGKATGQMFGSSEDTDSEKAA